MSGPDPDKGPKPAGPPEGQEAEGQPRPKKPKMYKGKYYRGKRLPDDYPAKRMETIRTSTALVRKVLDFLESTGKLPEIETAMRSHPGTHSQLPVRALLAAMLIAAIMTKTYRRTEITAVLAGLTRKAARMLGLLSGKPEDAKPISYNIVADQTKRLEGLYEAPPKAGDKGDEGDKGQRPEESVFDEAPADNGDEDDEGPVLDIEELCSSFIEAMFSDDTQGGAVALDATAIDSWLTAKTHVVESEARAARDDPEHELHDLLAHVEYGEDDKVIRNDDPFPRAIYHGGTNRLPGRMITGVFHNAAVLVREFTWYGDPDEIEIGEKPLPLVVAYSVSNNDDASHGVALVDEALRILGGGLQVHADQGYTKYVDGFVAQLRRRGCEPVMGMPVTALQKPKMVHLGKKQAGFWDFCGAQYPPWIPESRLLPKKGDTQKKLEDHFARLAKLAWSRNDKLPDGKTQLECPQCGGRITSNRRTRREGVTPKVTAEHIEAESSVDENGEPLYCCESSTITVDASEIGHFQIPPFGTKAYRLAHGYRNPVEGLFGQIMQDCGFRPGWCRVVGPTAQQIGGLMLITAYNMLHTNPTYAPKAKAEPAGKPRGENKPETATEPSAPTTG